MHTSYETSDRGNQMAFTADLRMKPDFRPERFEVKGRPEGSVTIEGSEATVREGGGRSDRIVGRNGRPPQGCQHRVLRARDRQSALHRREQVSVARLDR